MSPRSSFRTLDEAELRDSLIYLTCPICEEVLSEEPVFTPCHHTFCGKCVRQHLAAGNHTCPDCKKPLEEAQLQMNAMAANLLSTMKVRDARPLNPGAAPTPVLCAVLRQTCCIYKQHGCPWKGKVRELGNKLGSTLEVAVDTAQSGTAVLLLDTAQKKTATRRRTRPIL